MFFFVSTFFFFIIFFSTSFTYLFFFFNDTATTEIYTLSLHDALPICPLVAELPREKFSHMLSAGFIRFASFATDRKSTRLNSSHSQISYAVFCLKKKKKKNNKTKIKEIKCNINSFYRTHCTK